MVKKLKGIKKPSLAVIEEQSCWCLYFNMGDLYVVLIRWCNSNLKFDRIYNT